MTMRRANTPAALAIALFLMAGCATEKDAVVAPGVASDDAFIARTCRFLHRVLALDVKSLEDARGGVISIEPATAAGSPAGTTYASILQLPGLKDCTIFSYDETVAGDDDPYIDHALHCFSLELESNDAARAYVDDVYRCTSDIFSERTITEAWSRDGYDMIAFDGEVTPGGRELPADFGSVSYTRLTVDA